MRRESYLSQPPAVEIHTVDSGTDIILRKNIELVEKEEEHDGEPVTTTVWECDEVQCRYKGTVTEEEIKNRFDVWFSRANTKMIVEEMKDSSPTLEERIDALESGLADLAEVLCNG
nr:MAG TPA: Intermediate conductance calcium-activated potassium channel-helix bundle, copper, MEMBRANE PROTEIN [Caudoviricetes sp.]